MAEVFRAHDRVTGNLVAVKRLRVGSGIPDARDRFLREVELLSRVNHENCVRLLDLGTCEDGRPFAVLELLVGADLRASMRKPLPACQVIALCMQVLRGLEAMHAAGIVHRDLKPENIMITRNPDGSDRAVLVDFGAALPLSPDEYAGPEVARTAVGLVLGTPASISPEQLRGQPLDERADLYAVGVLMFEMLTGASPFPGEPTEVLRQKLRDDAPRLPPEIPEMLAMAVHSLLQPEPEYRLGSARATLRALTFARNEIRRIYRTHTWLDLLGPKHSVATRSHTQAQGWAPQY